MQSINPESSLLLRRRRSKSLAIGKRVTEIKFEVSQTDSDGDLDEHFKKDVDFNDWLLLQKRAWTKRPTLAFSPSFLLSPVCFTPLHTPEGTMSPFCHMEKHIPPNQEILASTAISAPVSANSNVFTFDENVSIPEQENNRRLCSIPEDRPLSFVDMLYCSAQIGAGRLLAKHDTSFNPPMSPSFTIATRSKRKATMKKANKQVFRPERQNPNEVTSTRDDDEKEERHCRWRRRFPGNSENGNKSLNRNTSSMSKNGAFSSMIGL